MESLARFSVSRPATVLMLVLAVLLLGGLSFRRLGVELLPDLSNPRLFVEVEAGDLPPAEVEARIAAPIEAAASLTRGVVDVASVSRAGAARVTVEYGWGADMDQAFLDLQKGMAEFAQRSPAGEVSVTRHDPNGRPVVVAAFRHPEVDDLDALRRTAESIVRSELVRLPGVAAVEIAGARRREVEVLADAYTLEAYAVTVEQLAAAIEGANRNMSGGSIVEMGRRYLIRGVGEIASVADLEGLVVAEVSGEEAGPAAAEGAGTQGREGSPASGAGEAPRPKPVYLRDLAEVRQVLAEPRSIVRLDGQRCLGLEIYKEARFNTLEAARAVRGQLEVLRRSLPGYEIVMIRDQSRFIAAAVSEVEETGLIGALLAVAVLFVFLRRAGATAVVSLAIPVSVVATFNLMYFGGLTLNLMTLGGLALGAGMLVDNAIVVVEERLPPPGGGRAPGPGRGARRRRGGRRHHQRHPDHRRRLPAHRLPPGGRGRAVPRAGVDRGLLAAVVAVRGPPRDPHALLPPPRRLGPAAGRGGPPSRATGPSSGPPCAGASRWRWRPRPRWRSPRPRCRAWAASSCPTSTPAACPCA